MANVTQGQGELGFIDKRRVPGQTGINIATPANYSSVSAMRTRLAALTGPLAGYYTTAMLDKMTYNDMVMALRQADDPTGL